MADKTVTIDVQSNLKEQTVEAKNLNKELDKAVEKARKSASRTGSRAADAALGVSETQTDTGLRRGSSGAGGRGGERDFARQAQGLGGLVHLYATFAANIYAVSAAFSALQKAADFERMEKSAEKMSVVLGINLNNAAKAMVNLTDGAVSYAEAIEKTNLAASAGLSTDQITKLTKVAKGASTALGRDMGDSLNRLVKGTVKLEPELLDELGILTKASEAYKIYATGVGKTEDELTKFEKTQAFVNAVIAEGESKFSSLYTTVETNPFTKLQASLENTSKSALSALNVGLKPIVSVLAENPTALVGVISLLITKLVNMAVPSLTQFGDKAAAAADKAASRLDDLSKRFDKYNTAVKQSQVSEANFQAKAASLSASNMQAKQLSIQTEINGKKELISINSELEKAIAKSNKNLYGKDIFASIFNKGPVEDVTSAIDKYSRTLQKAAAMNERIKTGARYSPEAKLAAEDRLTSIGKLQSAIATTEFSDEAKKYNGYLKEAEANLQHGLMLETQAAQVVLTRTQQRKLEAVELAKINAGTYKNLALSSEMGAGYKVLFSEVKVGWQEMNSKLLEQNSSFGRTFVERAKYIGTSFGLTLGATIMKGFVKAFNVVTIALAVTEIFTGIIASILGEAKNLGELESALDNSNQSHKLLGERVLQLSSLMQAGTNDINIYSKAQHLAGTSLNNYSDSLNNTYENFRKVNAEMRGGALWTKGVDLLKGLAGSDVGTQSAEAIAQDIIGAITTATEAGNTKLQDSIAKSLKLNPEDLNKFTTLRDRLKEIGSQGNFFAITNIRDAIKTAGTEALNTESRIASITEALKSANKEAEGVGAKRQFANPKYEDFYNTVLMIQKVTNETEKSKLFSQLFSGMSDDLRTELGLVSSDLKAFFSSDEFKKNKLKEAFDISAVGADFKRIMADMKNEAMLFFTNLENLKKSRGTGWGEQGQVGYTVSNTQGLEVLMEQQRMNLADAVDARKKVLDNIDLYVAEYGKSVGKELSPEEKAAAAKSITDAANNGIAAIESYIKDISELAGQKFSSRFSMMEQLSKIGDKLVAGGGTGITPSEIVQKALPEAIKKAPPKGKVSSIPTYPKDRLQPQKAQNELLQMEVKLEESKLALLDTELRIAKDSLGMYGDQYNQLLKNKIVTEQRVLDDKKAQEEYELNLKRLERIEGIKADKNVADKDKQIAQVDSIYQKEKVVLDNKFKNLQKQLDLEKALIPVKEEQARLEYAIAATSATQSGKALSQNLAIFREVAKYSDLEVAALSAQYESQVKLTEQKILEAKAADMLPEQSAKVLDAKKAELEIANKLYEAQRNQTKEALKAFELTGTGGIGNFMSNFGKEFGFQVREALKTAKSATDVFIGGIMTGIDNTITELTVRLKEGNLSISDLVKFARNQLADAFQQSAAQVLQNGWKQMMLQLVPAAADPLTVATMTATSGMAVLTASINALNVTLGGSAITGPVGGAGGLSGFLGGLFGGSTAGAAGGALTATNGLALNTAVAPVTMVAAKGGIMSEFGPLQLNTYAKGGIATGPQAAIFGEGSKNEAYVPLPDNRSIPVTLSGESGSKVNIGDTTINVTVDSSNGSSTVDVQGNADMAKSLGLAIKKTVHEELMNQARPGGMFYRG